MAKSATQPPRRAQRAAASAAIAHGRPFALITLPSTPIDTTRTSTVDYKMPPRKPLQFPPPGRRLIAGLPGEGISPLKLRLKPVRIAPGPRDLTSCAQAGFCAVS